MTSGRVFVELQAASAGASTHCMAPSLIYGQVVVAKDDLCGETTAKEAMEISSLENQNDRKGKEDMVAVYRLSRKSVTSK